MRSHPGSSTGSVWSVRTSSTHFQDPASATGCRCPADWGSASSESPEQPTTCQNRLQCLVFNTSLEGELLKDKKPNSIHLCIPQYKALCLVVVKQLFTNEDQHSQYKTGLLLHILSVLLFHWIFSSSELHRDEKGLHSYYTSVIKHQWDKSATHWVSVLICTTSIGIKT